MTHDADIFDRVMPYVDNLLLAIDVGAHKGLWAAKMASNFESVHCFEPNLFLYHRLCNWVSDLGCGNVTIHNVALLDVNGHAELCFEEGQESKLRSHFAIRTENGPILTRTLDSYGFENCGLLKIDVEGGDLAVLWGARRFLKQSKPVVIVEYKEKNALRFGWNLPQLYSFMKQNRYHLAFDSEPNKVYIHK